MIPRLIVLLASLVLSSGYASSNKDLNHTYECKFLNSLYMGVCDGQEYIYIEKYSQITFKQLRYYNEGFIKFHENEWITKSCHEIQSIPSEEKLSKNTYLFCEDLGLAFELYRTVAKQDYKEPKDLEKESMHMGHDHHRKQTIQIAKERKQAVQTKYELVLKHIKENPPTGEEEHDTSILKSIEQNQKDWLNHQYSFCQTRTLIEVYPSTSRLFVQTLNSCLAELNTKRIEYLDNLLKEIKQSH